MANGNAQMERMIRALNKLEGFGEDSVKKIADHVRGIVKDQVGRGVDPSGKPWVPTETGQRPLRNAAEHVSVKAVGTVLLISVDGHYALHHRGRARGGVPRRIIPTGNIPDPVVDGIQTTLKEEFTKIVRSA